MDWGTSNFRAFRLNATGEVVERRLSPAGVLSVQGRFLEVIREHVGDWLAAGEDRLLLSGMIGSRSGWIEAPYVSCPADLAEIAAAVVPVPFDGVEVRIVPGVKGFDPDGVPEVMRGEETEILGMMDSVHHSGNRSALVCLPGTHSKWIRIEDSAIVNFQTSMTGDVFSALRSSTILGHTMPREGEEDKNAFLRGVARSGGNGGLLHHLFGVRSLFLMELLKKEESASFLSGVLIGHEVRAIMPQGANVHLAGAAQLCSLYMLAIDACGGTSTAESEDACVRGHIAIARQLQWI